MGRLKKLPVIVMRAIPSKSQRYPTCGDYWKSCGTEQFRVSKMGNPDYEFLVLLHELVEWYLTEKRGISEHAISKFDVAYEKARAKGKHPDDAEPGDDSHAPYKLEHGAATGIERVMASMLGVDWAEYDKAVMDS